MRPAGIPRGGQTIAIELFHSHQSAQAIRRKPWDAIKTVSISIQRSRRALPPRSFAPEHGARFDEAVFARCVALDGGEEARRLAAMLAKMLLKAAAKRGWDAELLDEEGLSLRVSGRGCMSMSQEAGMHKFVSSSGKGGKRHTSYCRVEAEAAGPELAPVEIDERDVEFKSQKAGGPGGQHVNKVETAVRATHRPSGLSVLCASGRSQDMNKRSAVQWLGAKLAAAARDAAAGRRRDAWEASARVGAGEARRSYWLDEDRYVDGPTGRKGRASDALAGGCRELWTE